MFEINAIITMRVQTKVELKIRFGDSNGLRRNIRKRVLLIEVKTKKVVAIRKIMFCAINIGDVTIRARIRLEMWTFGLVIIDGLVSGI